MTGLYSRPNRPTGANPRPALQLDSTPRGGKRAPQTNDVDTDRRSLVYALDRFVGLDILEVTGW